MLTIKELYDHVEKEINEIKKDIKYLEGKRAAYADIRLDLYAMLDGGQENGNDD